MFSFQIQPRFCNGIESLLPLELNKPLISALGSYSTIFHRCPRNVPPLFHFLPKRFDLILRTSLLRRQPLLSMQRKRLPLRRWNPRKDPKLQDRLPSVEICHGLDGIATRFTEVPPNGIAAQGVEVFVYTQFFLAGNGHFVGFYKQVRCISCISMSV